MLHFTKNDIEKFDLRGNTIVDVCWDNKDSYGQEIVNRAVSHNGNIVGYVYYVDNDYVKAKVDETLVPEIDTGEYRSVSCEVACSK